eukprot:TRINITY_DN12029_c0_g1_i1.p1 TRINITY_DN12029_c0_g1~~TRINITY_DN12029_c0_g1_i1.p1  ORF type:complete len:290 (-),score=63.27 TRINITY_DN12029_c0_g1_i1:51-887(-)
MSSSHKPSNTLKSFTLCTWNILAPCFKRMIDSDGYISRESLYPNLFIPRMNEIIDVVTQYDVICIQEFWFGPEGFTGYFVDRMRELGYVYHGVKRSYRDDGVAMFVREVSVSVERVEVFDILLGDRVGLVAHLKVGKQSFVVGNVHLTFPYTEEEAFYWRKQQMQFFMKKAKRFAGRVGCRVPVIVCGDFNSPNVPDDNVLSYLKSEHFSSCYKWRGFVSHRNHEKEDMGADFIVLKDKNTKLSVGESYLYPRSLSENTWPEKFELSDHRPIVCNFSL